MEAGSGPYYPELHVFPEGKEGTRTSKSPSQNPYIIEEEDFPDGGKDFPDTPWEQKLKEQPLDKSTSESHVLDKGANNLMPANSASKSRRGWGGVE